MSSPNKKSKKSVAAKRSAAAASAAASSAAEAQPMDVAPATASASASTSTDATLMTASVATKTSTSSDAKMALSPAPAPKEIKVREKKEAQSLDEDDNLEEEYKLESTEKTRFPVTKKVAVQSALVKTMIEGDRDEKVIPLPNVKSEVLKKIVEYMKYHVDNPAKEIEKPLKSDKMTEVVSDVWDAEFVDVPQDNLFELILAANYLDLKPLLDLACAKVASMIKGKTPEQIRSTFNIANDLTESEEEMIRAENKWAEES